MVYAEALERQVEALRWLERHPELRRMTTLHRTLREAETYYWHPELLPVLAAGGASLPTTTRLDATMLPSAAGFCWFGAPLHVPAATAVDLMDIDPSEEGEAGTELASIEDFAVTAMAWWPETIPITDGSKQLLAQEALQSQPGFTGVVREEPTICVWTWVQLPLRDMAPDGSPWGAVPVQQWWFLNDDLQTNAQSNVEDGAPDAGGHRWGLAVFAAAALFLHQGLAVPEPPAQLDRPARRRLERAGWEPNPVVRVIRLRRVHTTPHEHHEPEDVAWACRWVVRGHWRQQWFPSVQQHRPLWIAPHVKGPEDKPMRAPRATVFAVVR